MDLYPAFPWGLKFVDEAIIDNAAVTILARCFKFIEASGRGPSINIGTNKLPDFYWVAAVRPFCYSSYEYTGNVESPHFILYRTNYALKDLADFPAGFGCGPRSPMRNFTCKAWTQP